MTPSGQGSAGFSLIEMLVALSIFAMVGVAGLTLLDTVLRSNRVTDSRLERISALDRGLTVVTRDLAASEPGSLVLGDNNLAFRRSVENGSLFVTLALNEDGVLLRQLSGGDLTDPVDQVLFDGIEQAGWQLLDGARQWQRNWPTGSTGDPDVLAAELTLTLTQTGTIRRLVELPQIAPSR